MLKLTTTRFFLGNLVADIIRGHSNADIVILNGGTLRSNKIHPVGNFSKGDLWKIFPYDIGDQLCVISISGRRLRYFS